MLVFLLALGFALVSCDNPAGDGIATTNYTVTFSVNGGSGMAPATQMAEAGSSITLPSGSGLSKAGAIFSGWNTKADGTGTNYAAGASYTPSDNVALYANWGVGYTVIFDLNGGSGTAPNITLYAKWSVLPLESVTGLANKLAWLQTNAASGGNYIIDVTTNESIDPQNLSYNNRSNITITLRGSSAKQTISLSSNGCMFSVGSGVTLILDNNITLQGKSSNTASLIRVTGSLIMNEGAEISGNSISGSNGSRGGNGLMASGKPGGNGGSVSGGGVYVSGTFTMNGGKILNNRVSGGDGGGGGDVQQASITYDHAFSGGRGGNGGNGYGGGVYVSGTFIMNGGEISNNRAYGGSGGNGGRDFSGFYSHNGYSGNNGAANGGGVYGSSTSNVRIVTGTIYGSNESDTILCNTASSGAALYNSGTAQYGTFNGETWVNNGILSTSNNTIKVVNGVLPHGG